MIGLNLGFSVYFYFIAVWSLPVMAIIGIIIGLKKKQNILLASGCILLAIWIFYFGKTLIR